jgi:hypothetical protein
MKTEKFLRAAIKADTAGISVSLFFETVTFCV